MKKDIDRPQLGANLGERRTHLTRITDVGCIASGAGDFFFQLAQAIG